MNNRVLGSSGLMVSPICLGTMTFGGRGYFKSMGELDQNEAHALVQASIEGGINFFDTADFYSQGLSEELLGKALGGKRKDVIVATKVYFAMGPGPDDVGLSKKHILVGCEQSLKRLGTDYIDLYQVHNFDYFTPLEETLEALHELVKQGKTDNMSCVNNQRNAAVVDQELFNQARDTGQRHKPGETNGVAKNRHR